MTTITINTRSVTLRDGVWRWDDTDEVAAPWRPLLDALTYSLYDTNAAGHLRVAATGTEVYVRDPESGLMFPAVRLETRVERAMTGRVGSRQVICVWLPSVAEGAYCPLHAPWVPCAESVDKAVRTCS